MNGINPIYLAIRPYFERLYLEFESIGLLSFYLWGSAVREDYIPQESDIDVIAILDSDFPQSKCVNLRYRSVYKKSQIPLLKIRTIYLYELERGTIRSELSRLINPKLLVLDFPSWKHLVAKKFHEVQFFGNRCTLEEAVKLRLESVYRRITQLKLKNKFDLFNYLVKEVFQLCHLLHKVEHGIHSFSYKTLLEYSTPCTEEILKRLIKIRENGYQINSFANSIRLIERFSNRLQRKLMETSLGETPTVLQCFQPTQGSLLLG